VTGTSLDTLKVDLSNRAPARRGRQIQLRLGELIEFFYNFELHKGLSGSSDYRLAVNPVFNEARGPINIFGARIDMKI